MAPTTTPRCPFCQTSMEDGNGVFYERGEFNGSTYTEEGTIPTYECPTCAAEIAVVYEPRRQNPPAPAKTYVVEYSLNWPGMYDQSGDFVTITTEEGETLEAAFERIMGHSRIHIITCDEEEQGD